MIKIKIEKSIKKIIPKKKKPIGSTSSTIKSKEPIEKPLLKIPSNFFIYQPSDHPAKSSTQTPKNYPHNKENMYQSVFLPKSKSSMINPINNLNSNCQKINTRGDYKFLYQIGSGGFGRVWKVIHKKQKTVLAMKQISKAKVILKKSVASVINQKSILEQLSNPFIINIKNAFQDRQFLYLTMQYLKGGDLRYHMCFYQYFTEQQTKFIVGCIILGLEYIHSRDIIHRDLKPQNLVFQESGYVRITDFGVARKNKANNSQQTSGTPGYMAPEVICRMNHSFEADFFALGVIIFEMIFGYRPYIGQSRKEIRDKILGHQAKISQKQLPNGWSSNCIDFVNRLLKRNRESRLGYNGINQLKDHPWLKSINWLQLAKKSLKPPFSPGIISQSLEYQREMQNSVQSQIDQEVVMLLRTAQIQKLFKSYQISKDKPKQPSCTRKL